MKYMGSKARISKHILPIILKDRKDGQCYVEPFVGGANSIAIVDGWRIGCDINKYLIALLSGVKNGASLEFDRSKEHYNAVRNEYKLGGNLKFSDYHIGLVGFMASANGRFFDGGYSGKSVTKLGTERNYIAESVRSLAKQSASLSDIDFFECDYTDLTIPDTSIVYCDPEYNGTKKYSGREVFDHDFFWQWCRDKVKDGHKVFISEYNAPDDFVCVWQQEVKSSLSANGKSGGSKKSVEKLFIHKSQA